MSLRTVPGMINVKTPIGSAVAEFNRSRAAQMPAVKEGWTPRGTELNTNISGRSSSGIPMKSPKLNSTSLTSSNFSVPSNANVQEPSMMVDVPTEAKMIDDSYRTTARPACPKTNDGHVVLINTKRNSPYSVKDEDKRLPVHCTCRDRTSRLNGAAGKKLNCSRETMPRTRETYGPRAQVRGQNPNSIYSGNAPHVVEGWRPKNTRKTVKAIVIVLIIAVAILLIACMLMKSMKPKHSIVFSKYPDMDSLMRSSQAPISPYSAPTIEGELLFGGKKAKKAKKCSCGKCPYCLKNKAKKAGKKKTIRKLNEVYSPDDEELI